MIRTTKIVTFYIELHVFFDISFSANIEIVLNLPKQTKLLLFIICNFVMLLIAYLLFLYLKRLRLLA